MVIRTSQDQGQKLDTRPQYDATELMRTDERSIEFRQTVQAGIGIRVKQQFLFAGKITQIMFHFPPGTNGLCRARLLKDERLFYPMNGWLALDDATPVFYVSVDYYPNEPLTFEVENTDQINPHTISCNVVIRFNAPNWW